MKKVLYTILILAGFLFNSCDKSGTSKVTFKVLDENGNYQVLKMVEVPNGQKIDNPIEGATWIENDYSKTKFPTDTRYKDTINMYLPIRYANLECLDSTAISSYPDTLAKYGINYTYTRPYTNPTTGITSIVRFNYGYGLLEDKPRKVDLTVGVSSDVVVHALLPVSEKMIKDGESAYNKSCKACHGADGDLRSPYLSVNGGPKFYMKLIQKIVQDNGSYYPSFNATGLYHRNYSPQNFYEVEALVSYINNRLYKTN